MRKVAIISTSPFLNAALLEKYQLVRKEVRLPGGNQGVPSVGTGETTSSKLENEAATLITAALVGPTVLGPHLARVGSAAAVDPTGDAAAVEQGKE